MLDIKTIFEQTAISLTCINLIIDFHRVANQRKLYLDLSFLKLKKNYGRLQNI